MNVKNLKFLLVFLTLFTSVVPKVILNVSVRASGSTLYVPGDYNTIQEAVDNANPGDTVYVYNGTYMENIQINKTLTLQGQDKSNTFIDGIGDFAITIQAEDIQIKDLTLFNASWGLVVYGDDYLKVQNCVIHDCLEHGIFLLGSDHSIIEDSSFFNNGIWGISLMLLENVTVKNCELHAGYDNGFYAWNSEYISVEGCDLYNNDAHGAFITNSHDINVVNCTFFENFYTGLIFDCTERVSILNSTVHSNLESGIWLQGSNLVDIEKCESYNNTWDGVTASASDFLHILDSSMYDNLDSGVALLDSCDYSLMKNIQTYSNANNGIYLYNSHVATICNINSYENLNGLYAESSNELYLSHSELYNNTMKGSYLISSESMIVDTNFTGNDSIGSWTESSETIYRYCYFTGNTMYGVSGPSSRNDARNCWWGDPSGPYHETENPSGTGDEADLGVTFDPWQTTPYKPDTLISSLRCHLLTTPWHMVYPSDDPGKPLVMGPAMLSDWTASGLFYSKLASVTEGVDTDPLHVNQSTGRPVGLPGEAIATFGGPDVNLVTYWAENGDAPVHFVIEGDRFYFKHANGSYIPGADLPISVINFGEDMFVLETFQDPDGRFVVILQGFGWKGSYAAGKYFDRVVFPELGSYCFGWIIVKWDDSNSDGYVNAPGDGDTYTLIATGN
jgi:parallel beta-helix repeat protein